MTPEEAIEVVEQESGTMTQRLARLVEILPAIDVEEYRPHVPRCACGAYLTVWNGRHSGRTLIYHPIGVRTCPRAGFRAEGEDPKDAMRVYIESAPFCDLDTIPESEPPLAPDDFSGEF